MWGGGVGVVLWDKHHVLLMFHLLFYVLHVT